MLLPVRCQSCGNSAIGTIASVFRLLYAELKKKVCEERGVTPENLPLDTQAQVNADELLDECGVPRYAFCCRATLMTTLELATLLAAGH